MPRPTARLDLFVLPEDPDAMVGASSDDWLKLGVKEQWWLENGRAGERAEALVDGGFRSVRVADSPDVRFYANQLGGFQVRCPETNASIIPSFSAAMTRWRGGGARILAPCGDCGQQHPLEALVYRPPAAFGRRALHLTDVGYGQIIPAALDILRSAWGPLRVVGRRPS